MALIETCSMTLALKHCPFCGEQKAIEIAHSKEGRLPGNVAVVHCRSCGAQVPSEDVFTMFAGGSNIDICEAQAVARWNNRAEAAGSDASVGQGAV